MSHLDLTEDERRLVQMYAREGNTTWNRVGFYAAVILPAVVFAAYGIARADVIAVGIGFGGLLLVMLWVIAQELRIAPLVAGLMRKIAAFERGRGAADGQGGGRG